MRRAATSTSGVRSLRESVDGSLGFAECSNPVIMSALGVSVTYAVAIRAGRCRLYPRHWQALAKLVDSLAGCVTRDRDLSLPHFRRTCSALGVSITYALAIRAGRRRLHPQHWEGASGVGWCQGGEIAHDSAGSSRLSYLARARHQSAIDTASLQSNNGGVFPS
jgi:hypothetical protein